MTVGVVGKSYLGRYPFNQSKVLGALPTSHLGTQGMPHACAARKGRARHVESGRLVINFHVCNLSVIAVGAHARHGPRHHARLCSFPAAGMEIQCGCRPMDEGHANHWLLNTPANAATGKARHFWASRRERPGRLHIKHCLTRPQFFARMLGTRLPHGRHPRETIAVKCLGLRLMSQTGVDAKKRRRH